MATFKFNGINHLALVCADMHVTVDFYANVLGMKLTKTINLPNRQGKHFFFDTGSGDALAFFWFPDGPLSVDTEEFARTTATPSTMNHSPSMFLPKALMTTASSWWAMASESVKWSTMPIPNLGSQRLTTIPCLFARCISVILTALSFSLRPGRAH
tara:strand:- start:74 stop:541 length:468 start_codon:yes stop_codon:yes gene_type:complete